MLPSPVSFTKTLVRSAHFVFTHSTSRLCVDEPVWAIGTGKVATPEIAQNVHATCRAILAEMYDQETADATRILYGGSVSPESVDELLAEPDIDGALVGGASLDAAKFGRIVNFVPTLQAA